MYVVLLSGGSGKRLWPLSNDLRSKQYIRLLPDPYRKGKQMSMVQRVWRQLGHAGLQDRALICAGRSQLEILHAELGGIPVAVEPERRDTFPAVALSCAYLADRMHATPDDIVCFLPVDPYVDDSYFATLHRLEQVAKDTHADIVLMGAKPTYPSEKYGYILPKAIHEGYLDVAGFKEKPDTKEAATLIAHGALWNCGVFCFRIGLVLDMLASQHLDTSYDRLFLSYAQLPKTSFDYAVLERATNLKAVPFDGMWKDLGTWNTLTDEMEEHAYGKVVLAPTNDHVHAINELEIPLVVTGMKDAVVVAAYDGILVTSNEESAHLKDLLKDLDQHPMFEEKQWGLQRTIDVTGTCTTRRLTIYQGMTATLHHAAGSLTLILLAGEAQAEGVPLAIGEASTVSAPTVSVVAIRQSEVLVVEQGKGRK